MMVQHDRTRAPSHPSKHLGLFRKRGPVVNFCDACRLHWEVFLKSGLYFAPGLMRDAAVAVCLFVCARAHAQVESKLCEGYADHVPSRG